MKWTVAVGAAAGRVSVRVSGRGRVRVRVRSGGGSSAGVRGLGLGRGQTACGRGHRARRPRGDALADRLPLRVPAQIVIAARPRRLGDQLQLAGRGRELEHRHAGKIRSKASGFPSARRALRSSRAPLSRRRFSSRMEGTMSTPSVNSSEPCSTRPSPPTDHVDHPLALQSLQDGVGVDLSGHQRWRARSIACSRSCGVRSNAFCNLAS